MRYVMFWALCSISWAVSAQNATMSGIVKNENGEPVAGASVFLDQTSYGAFTDENGLYSMTNLPGGPFLFRATYLGCQGFEDQIVLTDGAALVLNPTLDCSTGMAVRVGEAEIIEDATLAGSRTPVAKTDVDMEELRKNNLGQDIPFLLQNTPSVVVTSDAGAGVGYTGIRIRGSDASRVNVTINGIPYNDSESQGTFWVNVPDLASSADGIQIQRGVGTSTNGAGAFGGTVKLSTLNVDPVAYGSVQSSAGSFNTFKNTVSFGSGLVNDAFAFEGRLSQITSDGYLDRASADLKSYYASGAWYTDKTTLKAIVFGGKEITYQSWEGTPESRVNNDAEQMQIDAVNLGFNEEQTANLLNSGRTYNFYLYDNQVDNYAQDHYQLHFNYRINENLTFNLSPHYTYGRGFFEQFRNNDDWEDYGIDPIILDRDTLSGGAYTYDSALDNAQVNQSIVLDANGDTLTGPGGPLVAYETGLYSSDLVRRRWLDNHFYGAVGSLQLQRNRSVYTLGFGANQYDGDHFGEVIWSQIPQGPQKDFRYYDNVATKTDVNAYLKAEQRISNKLSGFADLQLRQVGYRTQGIDADRLPIDVTDDLTFFNPKVGLDYVFSEKSRVFASFAIANREPVRNDYIDAPNGAFPKPEQLQDLELGYQLQDKNYALGITLYNMQYRDQLVLTGQLNDVGSPVRQNVDNSYRRGLELVFSKTWFDQRLRLDLNGTLSQNKIQTYDELLYDYTNGFEILTTTYNETDIAFSPNRIATAQITGKPLRPGSKAELELSWITRHIGQQFLDNTSSSDRALDAYTVSDFRVVFGWKTKALENVSFTLLVNNVLDERYSSNGYTYSYVFGETITQNFLYPQAGTNFLAGINLRF